MKDMEKIYLDNCCYNRPFDDQSQLKIHLETQAKLKIQNDIKEGKYQLVWSYILDYENGKNPYEERKNAITPWRDVACECVYEKEPILLMAEELADKGLKVYDALHVAAAVDAGCGYFLTTDKKLLNTCVDGIEIISPLQFIVEMEETL